MTQKNPMQISDRMDEIDSALETEGMPSYSQMWATNAELREELERLRLRERLAMANTTLHGDLLQTELIVATASSVEQIRRQLVRLESDRGAGACGTTEPARTGTTTRSALVWRGRTQFSPSEISASLDSPTFS
ncbi:hypothetical protein CKCBHOJB_00021 [Thauera sp. GDN1]|uniref:hypothetical protein n=1 Tax=Thauera sp. GDN1 TaxID=2944810 RepID=UPI00247B2318|nr:hypothetical protein [Thauera sp. GDN1]WEN40495.1 hypothetical protein CKCBHOJB_00021 [Thauera sp. GDN1]